MRVSRALCLASSLTTLALAQCSSSPTPCYEDATCVAASSDGGPDVLTSNPDAGDGSGGTSSSSSGGPDAGDAGDGGGIIIPPGCDPTADPKDAAPCVSNDFAVFVDATNGTLTGAGTKESPVKSITDAVAKAKGKSRIYVCDGTYDEHVVVTTNVSIVGGFACKTWEYDGKKPRLAPTTKGNGYAIQTSAVSDVVFSDLDIKVPDATGDGESSIAVFVANSTVAFRRTDVVAGLGHAAKAAEQKKIADPAGTPGVPTGGNGAVGATNQCPDGSSVGGTGAKSGFSGATKGSPALSGGAAGISTTDGDCSAGGFGGNGSNGGNGAVAPSGTALGELTNAGWHPASGTNGGNGTLAQGGGGGGSSPQSGGGGGGAGGCGGAGGDGGRGGGASVAILAFSSSVDVIEGSLTARAAGSGGGGASGQKGQPFGPGGPGGTTTPAGCQGGRGGTGGEGGGGAGGAGGVSAAILYGGGTAPTVALTTAMTTGTLGNGGAGSNGNPGPNGTNVNIKEVK